jgi:hypothetical protein
VTLAAFLPPDRKPRLIYLNACDSQDIARALAATIPMAIGSTAPITNRAARAGAVTFYERVLSGTSIQHAFSVAQKMVEMLQDRQASAVLHVRPGLDPDDVVLHTVPRIIADFVNGDPTPRRGHYKIRLGLVGCPANTTQVVFFTDDEKFIDDEEDNLPEDLCLVARGVPVRGVLWVAAEDDWEINGDFRLFAAGVTGDGTTFSLASTLCEAIETRYHLASRHDLSSDIAAALAELRREDGTELDYAPRRREPLSPAQATNDRPSPGKQRVRIGASRANPRAPRAR